MLGTTNISTGPMNGLSISINGTNVLTYDGTTTKTLDITLSSLGAAASNHTHDSVYSKTSHGHYSVSDSGRTPALSGSEVIPRKGISMGQVYTNGYPTDYGNVLRINGTGAGELLCGWAPISGAYASLYYRNQRDSNPIWSDWACILDEKNFTNWAARFNHTHSKSQITDFPSSLPANGGNADTVDNLHASAFAPRQTNLVTGYDMNSARASGFYRLSSNHVNSCSLDWSQMIVCGGGGDTVAQLAISYYDSVIKFRGGNPYNSKGKWYPWAEVIDRSRFNPTKIQSAAPVTDALWAY